MIAIVGSRVDLKSLAHLLSNVPLVVFVIAVVGYLLSLAISSFRWWWLCRVAGVTATFQRCLTATLVGSYVNAFGLGTVGGDLLRATLLAVGGGSKSLAVATVAADRLLGLGVLAGIGAVSMLLVALPEGASHYRFVIVGFIALGVIIWFSIPHLLRWGATLPKVGKYLGEASTAFPSNPRVLLEVTLIALLFHVVQILLFFSILSCMGVEIPLPYLFAALPIVNIISTLPLSWMGLGVRDGLFLLFFTPTYMTKESAVLFATLWLFAIMSASLVGGLVAVLSGDLSGGSQNSVTATGES